MNTKKVIQKLKEDYPSKKIYINTEDKPEEIICEIEPSSDHPEYSSAIAVIDKTTLHFHKQAAEIYYVLEGTLNLFIENSRQVLKKDEYAVIKPGEKHYAKGNETWVLVYSEPGWSKEDHLFEEKEEVEIDYRGSQQKILVNNYKDSFNFYSKTLGLVVRYGDEKSNFAEFEVGGDSFSIYSFNSFTKLHKLSRPRDVDDPNQKSLLTLTVVDINATYKYLMSKKVKAMSEPTKNQELGLIVFYIFDTENNLIELNQMLD
jgi:mannose-6-phosphate isomerase-like protein (cupin superfamily)/predicted enzyme related to lactoylglutathione lyase